jgi:choline-phosphate cytidylyltransferase
VSFLNDKKFKLQNKIDEMKCKSKRVIEDVKEEFIQKWEEKSNEFIRTFLVLFGRDNLSQIWDRSKGRIKDALHRSPSREPSPSSDDVADGSSSKSTGSPPAKLFRSTTKSDITTVTSDDTSDDEEFHSPSATSFPSLGFTNPLKDNQ